MKAFILKRQFLCWRQPGQEEEDGRVELVLPTNYLKDADPFTGRTAEAVTIPAGSLLSYAVTEEDPMEVMA